MPNEMRVAPTRWSPLSCPGTRPSGLDSIVTSSSLSVSKRSRTASRIVAIWAAVSMVGVPPPKKTLVRAGRSGPMLRSAKSISATAPATYRSVAAVPPESDST